MRKPLTCNQTHTCGLREHGQDPVTTSHIRGPQIPRHTPSHHGQAQSMLHRPTDSQTCGHPQKRQHQRQMTGTTTASHVSPQPLLTATCHHRTASLSWPDPTIFYGEARDLDFYVKAFKKRIKCAPPWDFHGAPGVKTLCLHCRGCGSDPWSGKFHMSCGQRRQKRMCASQTSRTDGLTLASIFKGPQPHHEYLGNPRPF